MPALSLPDVQLANLFSGKPQHQITSLDDLIAAETRKLDTLKTHRKGLMQQLFPRVGEDDA